MKFQVGPKTCKWAYQIYLANCESKMSASTAIEKEDYVATFIEHASVVASFGVPLLTWD